MIKACRASFLLEGKTLDLQNKIESKVEWSEENFSFRFETKEAITITEFFLDIELEDSISLWRFLDYTWKKPGSGLLVANSHSPKILKLKSGLTVAAVNNSGCWEFQPDSGVLRWYFFHPMLSPTLVFDQADQKHFLGKQQIQIGTVIQNGLIAGKGKVEEWARTPLGFVPALCITDHSDFDTLANLRVQREFFKNLGIRITKGFFLFDYTHKSENASFEEPLGKKELQAWDQDGHELAYHALSQSYRGEISDQEFEAFETPLGVQPVDTYIDHGFHPYNYTKQKLAHWSEWYIHMYKKGIRRIWTYVDVGDANFFNLNQINPLDYTWDKIRKSSKLDSRFGVKQKISNDLRSYLKHRVSDSIFRQSLNLGGNLMGLKSRPSLHALKKSAASGFRLFSELLSPKNLGNILRNSGQVFEINRFGPLFFNSPDQSETQIQSFQTLAVRDYEIAFSENSLKKFSAEAGVVIAHTYLAYTGQNHQGRLFEDDSWRIRPEAQKGFERVAMLIQNKQLWNPTLREMHLFYSGLDKVEYGRKGDDLIIINYDGIVRNIA
ncbi:hypothetical protein [Algoriphagus sp. A40]|uniref:hypothetical protein n=1 Tax=Algoriphagus sp. A40 TaxID=1945863 RepID=UPI000987C9F4|nr:hypothetical protein [Algoriphagus sp. A40]OOG74589.1 hypothetical protein B0E43_11350 [Algoriphagus sp. A40]